MQNISQRENDPSYGKCIQILKISNLSPQTEICEIYDNFMKYGKLCEIQLNIDQSTNNQMQATIQYFNASPNHQNNVDLVKIQQLSDGLKICGQPIKTQIDVQQPPLQMNQMISAPPGIAQHSQDHLNSLHRSNGKNNGPLLNTGFFNTGTSLFSQNPQPKTMESKLKLDSLRSVWNDLNPPLPIIANTQPQGHFIGSGGGAQAINQTITGGAGGYSLPLFNHSKSQNQQQTSLVNKVFPPQQSDINQQIQQDSLKNLLPIQKIHQTGVTGVADFFHSIGGHNNNNNGNSNSNMNNNKNQPIGKPDQFSNAEIPSIINLQIPSSSQAQNMQLQPQQIEQQQQQIQNYNPNQLQYQQYGSPIKKPQSGPNDNKSTSPSSSQKRSQSQNSPIVKQNNNQTKLMDDVQSSEGEEGKQKNNNANNANNNNNNNSNTNKSIEKDNNANSTQQSSSQQNNNQKQNESQSQQNATQTQQQQNEQPQPVVNAIQESEWDIVGFGGKSSKKQSQAQSMSQQQQKQRANKQIKCEEYSSTGKCSAGEHCEKVKGHENCKHAQGKCKDKQCPLYHVIEQSTSTVTLKFVCHEFKQTGKCQKGNACPMVINHVICKFIKQYGKCNNGDNCNFFHPLVPKHLRVSNSNTLNQQNNTNNHNNVNSNNQDENANNQIQNQFRICKEFRETGDCALGDNCPSFRNHIVCKYLQRYGQCYNGDQCKFHHPNEHLCDALLTSSHKKNKHQNQSQNQNQNQDRNGQRECVVEEHDQQEDRAFSDENQENSHDD